MFLCLMIFLVSLSYAQKKHTNLMEKKFKNNQTAAYLELKMDSTLLMTFIKEPGISDEEKKAQLALIANKWGNPVVTFVYYDGEKEPYLRSHSEGLIERIRELISDNWEIKVKVH